ncbi:dUTP diphosphatase [Alteribacillus bidgolensis]|uniref:Dimeric dUTPase, all-alpha-NTP-PPase (MazG) superfamily n=1 Tax=Alteribacillus bidgolensis TaxID=930129 RepID=A0A1G8F032_9BACI|nr:dUTP diphosphatase [Alteribacillus bidgolensis]SDH75369.1 Dimeric dUTPase, all-alpha-NTP-PPase (MazG) superfamily [Alteribacillus bidgolensis]
MKQLFSIQRTLDERILKEHDLKREDIFMDKVLAFQVEAAELANETRCFKYWSHKPASSQAVILEEYVDGLHFILSIGIDKGWEEFPFQKEKNNRSLSGQFQAVFQAAAALTKKTEKQAYIELFQEYLQLGMQLGFSNDAVERAYLEKNEMNHKRQTEGY